MSGGVLRDMEILKTFHLKLTNEHGLSASSADQVTKNARVVKRQAGELVFAAGDDLQELFFIGSGLVRYFYVTPDGREFNKSFVSSGSVVTCLSSFLERLPAPFFTEALDTSILIAVPMDELRSLRQTDPEVERLINRFVTNLALQKEKREASFLLEDAAGRYEAFLRNFPDVAARIPQYHIASYLGITPVALSRIRGRRARQHGS